MNFLFLESHNSCMLPALVSLHHRTSRSASRLAAGGVVVVFCDAPAGRGSDSSGCLRGEGRKSKLPRFHSPLSCQGADAQSQVCTRRRDVHRQLSWPMLGVLEGGALLVISSFQPLSSHSVYSWGTSKPLGSHEADATAVIYKPVFPYYFFIIAALLGVEDRT